MIVSELKAILEEKPDRNLHIMIPSSFFVGDHFHITEVGRVQKTFIDCGGTRRESISCMLQVWVADDRDHRLLAGKLAKILNMAGSVLGSDGLPVEVEFGEPVVSQYFINDFRTTPEAITFMLGGKQADCLAPDKCGITGCC